MNYEVIEKTPETLLKNGTLTYRVPSMYEVFLHNDDFTPMEFVILVLEKIFFMDNTKAKQVMLLAHRDGKALCGVYTKDIADTKVCEVIEYARSNEHPLICSVGPAS